MPKSSYLPMAALLLLALPLQAQVITGATRATAARDSLLQIARQTRQELVQQTGFSISAPRRGARRHVARGYRPIAKKDPSTDQGKRELAWKEKTVYRRNGQVKTLYIAQLNGRQILQERRLNGTVLWLTLARPLELTPSNVPTSSGYYGVYLQGGYLSWGGRRYLLPSTP